MEDDFDSTRQKASEFASKVFGEELQYENSPPIYDEAVVIELRGLLKARAEIYARFRQLTGEDNPNFALSKAREIVENAQNREVIVDEVTPPSQITYPDDRDRSTSVRAVSGGLPTLGRKR